MNDQKTVELSDVQAGDVVRVTVARRYGEEQECAGSWEGTVRSVNVDDDTVTINDDYNEDGRILRRGGSNPDAEDPSGPDTTLVLRKRSVDGLARYYRIINSNNRRVDVEKARRRLNQLIADTGRIKKVSYSGREELTREFQHKLVELGEAIEELA